MRRLLPLALLLAVLVSSSRAGEAKPAENPAVQDVVYFSDHGPVFLRLHLWVDGKPFRQRWQEFIAAAFRYLDRDGDGTLNREEMARVPEADQLLNGSLRGTLRKGKDLAKLDRSGDGKLTPEELAQFYLHGGAAPFQVRTGTGPGQTGAIFLDSGRLSNRAGSASELNKALYALLDTNSDGALSLAELKAAPALLRRADRNDDEMVSSRELLPESANSASNGVVLVNFDGNWDVQSVLVPFHRITPGDPPTRLVTELRRHYGVVKGKESSKPLSREAMGLSKERFAQLDKNKDGGLDDGELSAFSEFEPDLELAVRIGTRKKDEKQVAVLRKGPRVPGLGMHVLEGMGQTLLTLEIGTTEIGLTFAAPSGGTWVRFTAVNSRSLAQFKSLDRDKNGYLDRNEAKPNPFFRSEFAQMDGDGDGMVFEKEFKAHLARTQELRDLARRGIVSLSFSDKGRGLFDVMDPDGDGRLSERELRGLPARVAGLDRNKDGQIHAHEVPRRYQARFTQGGVGGGTAFRAVAIAINGAPLADPSVPERSKGPTWFRKMDRNRDGDLSRREFLGSSRSFRRIDRDGDGLIDPQEASQASK
jgi:Ca2+-binding EF-hand superfamily protein